MARSAFSGRVLVLLGILLLALGAFAWWRAQPAVPDEPAPTGDAREQLPQERSKPPRPAGRRAVRPAPGWLDAARRAMGETREDDCGPYRLLTDSSEARLAEVCERIGAALDSVYRSRLGVEPIGEPRGAVVVFSRAEAFRLFTAQVGSLPSGYSGFSRATRGVVALSQEGVGLDTLAQTLAHELTHLVNRRALGVNLPRWLSEGLADAVGDAASAEGLGPLEGFAGVEAQRRRLLEAYRGGHPPSLAKLVSLDRSGFDREVVSFDYEQSALLVRFLLLDPELAPRFRSFLAGVAAGGGYAPELLAEELGLGWDELEKRFRAWLEN